MGNLSSAPSLEAASKAARNLMAPAVESLRADLAFVACLPLGTMVSTYSRHTFFFLSSFKLMKEAEIRSQTLIRMMLFLEGALI